MSTSPKIDKEWLKEVCKWLSVEIWIKFVEKFKLGFTIQFCTDTIRAKR